MAEKGFRSWRVILDFRKSVLSTSVTDCSYFFVISDKFFVVVGLKKIISGLEKVWNFKVLNLWEPWIIINEKGWECTP